MLDNEVWIPIFAVTALILIVKLAWRPRRKKVIRVTPDSLKISRHVALQVLPLVEDESSHPIDEKLLPYPKEKVKSALKILAYQFTRSNQKDELHRIKKCYIELARFQDLELAGENVDSICTRERARLDSEINRSILSAKG